MPDQSPIDQHRDAMADVVRITHELRTLAMAFRQTGNEYIAAQLWHLTSGLQDAERMARSAFGNVNHQLFQQAQQASTNMLVAALAVVEMNQPKEFTS